MIIGDKCNMLTKYVATETHTYFKGDHCVTILVVKWDLMGSQCH